MLYVDVTSMEEGTQAPAFTDDNQVWLKPALGRGSKGSRKKKGKTDLLGGSDGENSDGTGTLVWF